MRKSFRSVLALVVLGMGFKAGAAPISVSPSNQKLIALFKKMDAEKFSESQKAALGTYMSYLESAIDDPKIRKSQMVKAGQECLKKHFGSKASQMARRAEEAMVPAQMSEAKAIGREAEADVFDTTNEGMMILVQACGRI